MFQSQEGVIGMTDIGEGFSVGAVASGRGNCGLGREGDRRLTDLTHLRPSDFLQVLSIG